MDSDVLFDDPLGHAVVCLEGIPSSAEFEQTVTVPLQGVKSGRTTWSTATSEPRTPTTMR